MDQGRLFTRTPALFPRSGTGRTKCDWPALADGFVFAAFWPT